MLFKFHPNLFLRRLYSSVYKTELEGDGKERETKEDGRDTKIDGSYIF
jgi:hypothetical protein